MAPAAADTAAPATAGTSLGEIVSRSSLKASPLNPRKRFDDASMAELIDNIQKNGVIVPLIVRRRKNGVVEIIDGERRFRAATAASVTTVPVIFRDTLTDGEVIEIMLLNQLQRQDLTPLEEAHGFKALLDSNPAKYSRAYIADRIGMSEKWVFDRMRLLDLIPILKTLLDADRILVGHAELLAKLKPEDQERALEEPDHRGVSGLWQRETDRLRLDDEDDEEPTAKNLYRGLKPVTVRELESWIAHHVRFDVAHMAAAAPLEFGPVAEQVEAAKAEPGRGKKVIAITHDHRVDDDAKDPSERTYGYQSWERADGQEKSKTCEHSVLGTFVAGPGYGTTLQVCVNRDKCTVHFGKVIKEREKNTKLRQTGKGGQAAQREEKAREAEDRKRAAEEAERKAWEALKPKAIAAIEAHVRKLPFTRVLAEVARHYQSKAKKADQLITELAVAIATEHDHYRAYLERDTKRFGFDLKKFVGANMPKPEPKAAKKATKR